MEPVSFLAIAAFFFGGGVVYKTEQVKKVDKPAIVQEVKKAKK